MDLDGTGVYRISTGVGFLDHMLEQLSRHSLIDLTVNGAVVPALVQPTKQGELFVLDRRTGQPLLPVVEKAAPQGAAVGDRTAPTQPVSALPNLMRQEVERDPTNQPLLEIETSADADYGVLAKVLAHAKNADMQKIGFVQND